MIVGNLIAKLSLDAKGFGAGITKATTQLKALAVTGIVYTTKRLADMAIEMQAIDRRMNFVTGGGQKLERSLDFIRRTAKSLSLSLETLTDSYAKLAAATRMSGLSTEQVESIFLALSEASSVYGLSAEKTKLAFMAVEQMASKGVISMEELRRQLGDQLPGALDTMARALGVSTAELNKLVASGQLISKDVLPLFALQLRSDMVEAVSKLGKGVRSSMADMKTAWFDLKKELTKEGGLGESVLKGLIDIMWGITTAAKMAVQAINSLTSAMKGLDQASGLALKGVADMPKKIADSSDAVQDEINQLNEQLVEDQKKFWANFGTSTEDELKKWNDAVVQSFAGVASEFTSLIVGMATGADVSFRKMIDNMVVKILEFTTHMLVVRPILEWFASWVQSVTAPGGAGSKGLMGMLFGALGARVAPTAMAEGGMINEPVAGVGLKSQTPYLLGEQGPEAVIPEDKLSGGSQQVNVTISAVDAKSFNQLMKENPQAVIGPIINAINGGDRGLNNSLRLAVS